MPIEKIKIKCNIPEGYIFSRYGKPKKGEIFVINERTIKKASMDLTANWVIIEKPLNSVKPSKKVIKFRNWLMKSGDIVVWQLGQGTSCPEDLPIFVSWVGDWQQIEVEADGNNSG